MQIEGCAAVVTGGASGLGRATCQALARAGARVALFDIDQDRGKAIAQELGGVFCAVDISDEASVEAGFELARAAHGQERILVSCAGIGNAFKTASRSRETGATSHFPLSDFARVLKINLFGTFCCVAKSAVGMLNLEPLEDDERGVIVTTASIAAIEGQIGQAAYAASKAGIAGMTLPIARDLMSEGIRINTILPGSFDTPLLATANDNLRERLVASTPFPRRMGRPEEYASLVLEMCRNTFLNGAQVRLDAATRLGPR
jgi:NAD(P)-dependent dehydrogenase (short-subunit alcohol dehydrogenase family)